MQVFLYAIFMIIFSTCPTLAQIQQGYDAERPHIVIDNSVLEELKGYEPPPMFGDQTSKPITLPASPNLTAPKPETLLKHPVQNFRVLTERNSEVTKSAVQPQSPSLQKIEDKIQVVQPKKEIIQKPIKPTTTAYKPKASPTMPAVPPIHVEKDILPVLPLPTPDIENKSTPSIGERMIDAALERQIEKDNNKIKETLTEEKDKANKKSVTKISKNTLEFQSGQTNLSEKIKAQLKKNIMPEITNDMNARIQILSFATSPDKLDSSAKRISLARALSVRDYLKDMNIDVSRIDVRALATDNSNPPDRVNITLLK